MPPPTLQAYRALARSRCVRELFAHALTHFVPAGFCGRALAWAPALPTVLVRTPDGHARWRRRIIPPAYNNSHAPPTPRTHPPACRQRLFTRAHRADMQSYIEASAYVCSNAPDFTNLPDARRSMRSTTR
ncbi:hypothetical protein FRC12_019148 [Ceratobasidium sp. 428]|nr:hypothetical protein FRC12_019148 [Ceratobasidium sp. 428]